MANESTSLNALSDTSDTSAADTATRLKARCQALVARPLAITEHRGKVGSKLADYTAAAGFLPIVSTEGELEAALFHVGYTLKTKVTEAAAGTGNPAANLRPLCFTVNGGPGSASLWLHLGCVGPKRVAINNDGTAPAPPYAVVDNPHTWFAHADVVFIDPPHTGYSVSASEAAKKTHLSVEGDVQVLAEFIRLYLTRNKRWGSPVYLLGESYGTTRSAALAETLVERGVPLSGLLLVSVAMDFQTIVFAPKNELPFATFLPAFAQTALYHGKTRGESLQTPPKIRAAAEAFVLEDYLPALYRGSAVQGAQRTRLVKRMADLTGLAERLIDDRNLRISDRTFFIELLRDQGQVVGRLESRVTGPMGASKDTTFEFDPGLGALMGPYNMACMAYYREQLNIDYDERYEIINMATNKAWDFGEGNQFVATSVHLANAMRRNPHLKVFVASGYYDLGTPYAATDYSLAHLDIDAEVRQRITHHYYDAGHMMYSRLTDLAKLEKDVAAWLS